MVSATSATSRAYEETWKSKDVASWSNAEVRHFLDTVLPGHTCLGAFGHTSGKVLSTLSKDDLRRQTKDEEATNVIWAELGRKQEFQTEQTGIKSKGLEPFLLYIRTPAEVMLELEVTPHQLISDVKARIAALEGTPVERQRLTKNGATLMDSKTLDSCKLGQGSILLLVPRLNAAGLGQRNFAPTSIRNGQLALEEPVRSSGMPRPRIPVVCTDIARPFPMNLEFQSVADYQTFMVSLQRETGRRDMTSTVRAAVQADENSPYLEILSADNMRRPVQTRIAFDPVAEVLTIDTVGDMLTDNTRYRALLHLKSEQKLANLVTGIRPVQ
eukprot:TRINITY_DN8238_c0_g2_i1.p1 TRINITY_DN8238_c0_g2~~TRINITY_DN8238_c0_g2_i1.p1  ORF type:complete len:349 (-),score=38.96 TRINITY_DN8238_c0_g2_i1:533-1516(-)